MRHPSRALRAGVRMIPTLKSGERVLSGVILRADAVRNFVEEHLAAAQQHEK